MENQITLFQNEEFGKIRIISIDGQPWFVGKDVAEILGYSDTNQAIRNHVDKEDKLIRNFNGSGQNRNMLITNESGLYSLILSSKLPKARDFKRWVTSEVLPSIRKHGAYMTESTIDKILQDPDFGIRLLMELKAEKENNIMLNDTITELAPKAHYCDIILKSKDLEIVSIIAKDYGMSAVAFNQLLHKLKIQFKVDGRWVLYQDYAGNEYTQSDTSIVNGCKVVTQTKWTQKGRKFLYEFLKQRKILPAIERDLAQ